MADLIVRLQHLLAGKDAPSGRQHLWRWMGPVLSAVGSFAVIWIAMEGLDPLTRLPVALLAAVVLGTIAAGYLAVDEV